MTCLCDDDGALMVTRWYDSAMVMLQWFNRADAMKDDDAMTMK